MCLNFMWRAFWPHGESSLSSGGLDNRSEQRGAGARTNARARVTNRQDERAQTTTGHPENQEEQGICARVEIAGWKEKEERREETMWLVCTPYVPALDVEGFLDT